MLPRALAAAAKLSSRQTAAAAALRTHSHTPALRPTAATIRAGAASDATPYAHTTSFLLSARRSYASKSPSNDGTVPPGGDSSPAATTNKQAQTEKTQPQGTGTAASDSSAASHDATTTTQSQPAQPPPPPPTGDSAAAATEQANPFLQDLKNMPLPDLTKGLPSTIFSELEQQKKRGRPGLPNLTEDPDLSAEYDPTNANAAAGAGGAGKGSAGGSGGDGSGPEYVSSTDQRREKMASVSYAFFWTGAAGVALYLGRNWASAEEEHAHPDAPSGWSPAAWWKRVKARYSDITSYYADPPFPKLLPDEDPALRQPYTLVLSLEDLLVHNEWTREHGWRLAKRPGVDYFLRYLNQYYELVLFTSVPVMQADQVLRKLDPFRIMRWPLGREAARYEKGQYIKDLSYLNRDLSKVIIIDTKPEHVKAQPENAILLPKWTGNPSDKGLVALIPFLEYIAGVGMEDVRTVLKSFEGCPNGDIPAEFLRREKIMREKHAAQVAEEQKHKPKRSVSGLASLLGMKPTAAGPLGDATGAGAADAGDKMFLDLIRERGQKNYEYMDKEIRENGPKWLAEMAAEEEKARQMQMQSMKQGFFGSLGLGGGKSGEEEAKKA